MLKRVKKWLGIEGVKVELVLPDTITEKSSLISGKVRLYSMNPQTISALHFKLVEKYHRGRKKNRQTDEYLMAEKDHYQIIEVPEKEIIEVDFELPFEMVESRMDQLEDKNFVLKGMVKAAKLLKSVKSEYQLEVEADVVGTALNPFARQLVDIV